MTPIAFFNRKTGQYFKFTTIYDLAYVKHIDYHIHNQVSRCMLGELQYIQFSLFLGLKIGNGALWYLLAFSSQPTLNFAKMAATKKSKCDNTKEIWMLKKVLSPKSRQGKKLFFSEKDLMGETVLVQVE